MCGKRTQTKSSMVPRTNCSPNVSYVDVRIFIEAQAGTFFLSQSSQFEAKSDVLCKQRDIYHQKRTQNNFKILSFLVRHLKNKPWLYRANVSSLKRKKFNGPSSVSGSGLGR